MKRRWFGGRVSRLILIWFYVTLAEWKRCTSKPEKNLLDGGANLDIKGFCCLSLNPQLRDPNPNSPNSQPGLFACHFRNLRPVRGTGRLGCSQIAGSSLNHSSFLSQDLSHQPFLLLVNRCLVPGRPSISWLSSPKVSGPPRVPLLPRASLPMLYRPLGALEYTRAPHLKNSFLILKILCCRLHTPAYACNSFRGFPCCVLEDGSGVWYCLQLPLPVVGSLSGD